MWVAKLMTILRIKNCFNVFIGLTCQKYFESNMISTIKILIKLKNETLLTVWPQNEQPLYVGEPLTSPTVTCANNDNP